jgi:hypothetical protein
MSILQISRLACSVARIKLVFRVTGSWFLGSMMVLFLLDEDSNRLTRLTFDDWMALFNLLCFVAES